MKKLSILSVLVLSIACLLSACNKDVDAGTSQWDSPRQVRFFMHTAQPPMVRTATDENLNTQFTKGDSVGVFVYMRAEDNSDGKAYVSNAKYTFDGANWMPEPGGEITIGEEDVVNFYAYFPYREDVTDYKNVAHTVSGEQNVLVDDIPQNYNNSDLLVAKNTTSVAGTEVIGLIFTHAFSLVQVRLTGAMANDPGITLNLCGIKATATADLTSEVYPSASGEPGDIQMHLFSAEQGNMLYRAVVPAQTIAANAKILAATMGSNTYEYNNADAVLELNAASARTLNVMLGNPIDVTLGDQNIDQWVEDPSVDLVQRENLIAIALSPTTQFMPFELDLWPSGTTPGWWKKSYYDVADTEKPISVNVSEQPLLGMACSFEAGTMTKNGYGVGYYLTGGEYPTGKYELTFCGSKIAGSKLVVVLSAEAAEERIYFAGGYGTEIITSAGSLSGNRLGVYCNNKLRPVADLTEDNMKHRIVFDLSKKYTDTSVNTTAVPTATYDTLTLLFGLGAANTGFNISNVKLERIE